MALPFRTIESIVGDRVSSVDDEPMMQSSVQSPSNVRVGMNILLGAHEHGTNQIKNIDNDITKSVQKLQELMRERAFISVLVAVAAEFYTDVPRPSGTYPVQDPLQIVP